MRLRAALVLALAATPVAGAARAGNCAPHADVVIRLAERYGESRQSIALAANNAVVEVFASLETGTWTLVMTRPGQLTCVMASGVAYDHTAEPLPNTDAPA